MADLAKSVLESAGRRIGLFWHGEVGESDAPRASLYITDPPYNIGANYGGGVNDRLSSEDYSEMLQKVLSVCYENAAEDAHMFLIHYPEKIAEMWPLLTERWEFRQWISWVYPTNTGHSSSKWTRAHRAIIWLTKGDPYFHPRGVTQRFKNPSASVVKEKVMQGVKGVALYNWWEIPQVKNISKENREYENQIPSELIRRIILCASRPGDWVADPFAGTFSTARTALELGRRSWGCDINPEVCRYWPEKSEWQPREDDGEEGHVDESEHDDVLVHITQDQLDRAMQKLLGEATEEQLTRVIGRVNGPRVFTLLNENSSEG